MKNNLFFKFISKIQGLLFIFYTFNSMFTNEQLKDLNDRSIALRGFL